MNKKEEIIEQQKIGQQIMIIRMIHDEIDKVSRGGFSLNDYKNNENYNGGICGMSFYHGTTDLFEMSVLLPAIETGNLREDWRNQRFCSIGVGRRCY